MKVILDSNILLISLPKRSIYRPVFDAFLEGKFTLVVSNEVLSEYIEVLERYTNSTIAANVAELLLNHSNVEKREAYFRWNLIENDYDDNKYVDLAVASNTDYLVTNDRHFLCLESIEFPRVPIINLEDFMILLPQIKND